MPARRQLRKMSAAEMSEGRQFALLYRAVARSKTKFLFHVKQKSFERGLSFECASRSNGVAVRGAVTRRSYNGAAALNNLAIVIASVCFIADDGKVTFGGFDWIGLPRKSRGGHFNLCFQLAARCYARKTEMPRSVFIAHGLSIRFPNDLEVHPCGSC